MLYITNSAVSAYRLFRQAIKHNFLAEQELLPDVGDCFAVMIYDGKVRLETINERYIPRTNGKPCKEFSYYFKKEAF